MTEPTSHAHAMRRLNIIGLLTVVVLTGGVGGWAATSQLSGAVIAPGSIVVESNTKKVQHPTGGVVGQILAKDGDLVGEGQLLLRLDETITRATLGIVRAQLDELSIREARLLAERDGQSEVLLPAALAARREAPEIVAALANEASLFRSRAEARSGQKSQLRERITQVREEIGGLAAQRTAKEQEIQFIAEELAGVRDLYAKNLISIQRLMALQRDEVKLKGEHGHFTAEIARASGKIGELELQIIQLEQDFRTEILRDLRDAHAKLAELRERLVAAEDQLKRVDIRSPYTGIVHQLSAHTVGGVVAAGETIMLIVSPQDSLVVEARVAPQDIDQVSVGSSSVARIMAGNQRVIPDIFARITRVSADLSRETSTNSAYYVVRAALDDESISRLQEIKLLPGMPVELFIQTQTRTPLAYLLRPLYEQVDRALRER